MFAGVALTFGLLTHINLCLYKSAFNYKLEKPGSIDYQYSTLASINCCPISFLKADFEFFFVTILLRIKVSNKFNLVIKIEDIQTIYKLKKITTEKKEEKLEVFKINYFGIRLLGGMKLFKASCSITDVKLRLARLYSDGTHCTTWQY